MLRIIILVQAKSLDLIPAVAEKQTAAPNCVHVEKEIRYVQENADVFYVGNAKIINHFFKLYKY